MTRASYVVFPEEHLGRPDWRGHRCQFHYAIRRSNGSLVFRTQKREDAAEILGNLNYAKARAVAA